MPLLLVERLPVVPRAGHRRYPGNMTTPAEHEPQPGQEDLAAAVGHDVTPERRAKARAWAREVLAHRPDPDDTAATRAALGLPPRHAA